MTSPINVNNVITESNIPRFLLKLWKLVDDPEFQSFITWDKSGVSFRICDPYGFSSHVLPLYFKHNNLNSFIRQLNMYGFRKVNSLEKGSLKPPYGEAETLEFQHPYFVMDHPELLEFIRRKTAPSSSRLISDTSGSSNNLALENRIKKDEPPLNVVTIDGRKFVLQPTIPPERPFGELVPMQRASAGQSTDEVTILREKLDHVLQEMHKIRTTQFNVDQQFSRIQLENETLWREVASMRRTYLKQQEIVNKLIKFILLFTSRRTSSGQDANGGKGIQLAKRHLLAIGSANDAPVKRQRANDERRQLADVAAAENVEESSAAGIIETLERELLKPVAEEASPTTLARQAPATAPSTSTSAAPLSLAVRPTTGGDNVAIDDIYDEFFIPTSTVSADERTVATAERPSSSSCLPPSAAGGGTPFIDNVTSGDKVVRRPLRLTKWTLNAVPPTPALQRLPPSPFFNDGVTSAFGVPTAPSPPQHIVVTSADSQAPTAAALYPSTSSSSSYEVVDEGCVESDANLASTPHLTSDANALSSMDSTLANYNYSAPSYVLL